MLSHERAQRFTANARLTGPTHRRPYSGVVGGCQVPRSRATVVRGAMKPISTLGKPLRSVDLNTKQPSEAGWERSKTG